jgi:hypothetical protein
MLLEMWIGRREAAMDISPRALDDMSRQQAALAAKLSALYE